MQVNTRFDKLKPIFLNKANYTFDLQKDLDDFVSSHVSVIEDIQYRDLTTDLKYLMKDDISVESKLQFEKQFTEIIANPQKAVILFNYYPLGQWVYLSEINDNSFTFHAIHLHPQEGSNDAVTGMYRFNALFEEKEIVFCMMKNLCKVADSNRLFESKFNEYRNMFDGSMEDFLDCLIKSEDYQFRLSSNWEQLNLFPKYDILRKRIIEKFDNIEPTYQVEDKKVKGDIDKASTFKERLEALKDIEQGNGKPETSNITLINFFDEPSKYPIILKLLSDKGYSYPNTNVWNTQSSFLIRVLKNLFLKKYFNKKPTNEEYKAIALNTFSCYLCIDTAKRNNSKDTDTDLVFIPLSTTI